MKDWQKCMISLLDLPFGSKSEPPLPPPMGSVVRAVLEDLLEAQELEHAQRDGGVEAQAALVGADCRVELNAVTAVDLHLARIVDPRHAEHDDALGLDEALEKGGLLVLGMSIESGLQGCPEPR